MVQWVALGASAGILSGMLYDLANVGINESFLNEVEQELQPGKVAVIAEAWEEWVMPVDTRMEALDGIVVRHTIEETVFSVFDRDVEIREAELTSLETKYNRATREEKSKLKAKMDAAKTKLKSVQENIKKAIEMADQKQEAKIKFMQEQLARVPSEMRDKVEGRIAGLRSKYKQRTEKLNQAWKLIKESLTT